MTFFAGTCRSIGNERTRTVDQPARSAESYRNVLEPLMYSAVTRNIEVQVRPFYLEDRSDPSENRYVWGYQITIDNQSDDFVQLLSRYWHITDGTGRVEEVRGPGVVGDQPELNPGDSYQYTSGCPLSTPSGIMVGHYTMRNKRGETFDIAIPAFSLDLPGTRRTVN
jgi:ApaG protein